MTKILLLQPADPRAEMYVNPIELQRLAGGLLQRESHPVTVDLVDMNVAAAPADVALRKVLSETQILCVATPAGSLDQIMRIPIAEFLHKRGQIVFLGETVTDGLTEQFLRRFGDGNGRLFAVVGRTEAQTIALLDSLIAGRRDFDRLANVHWIDEDGAYRSSARVALSTREQISKPYFSREIIQEIRSRGLFVLMDGLTRGCEHHCNYCHLNNDDRTASRVQDVAGHVPGVMAEVASAVGRHMYVQFTDENFFGGQNKNETSARLARVHALAADLVKVGYRGVIGVDTRVDTVINSRETPIEAMDRARAWRALRGAGLRYAYLGIESLSQSQLKRYSKRLKPQAVLPALRFLDEIDVAYTVGLIVLDPLVHVEEIAETIKFIEDNQLYGNVASLFKEMRLGLRDPYVKMLKGHGTAPDRRVGNLVHLDRGSVPYQDARLEPLLPIVRHVHRLFSESGYRHSDLAAMQAFGNLASDSPIRSIPALVGAMEVDIWKYLLSGAAASDDRRSTQDVLEICRRTIDNVKKILSADEMSSAEFESGRAAIHGYYRRVFERISPQMLRAA